MIEQDHILKCSSHCLHSLILDGRNTKVTNLAVEVHVKLSKLNCLLDQSWKKNIPTSWMISSLDVQWEVEESANRPYHEPHPERYEDALDRIDELRSAVPVQHVNMIRTIRKAFTRCKEPRSMNSITYAKSDKRSFKTSP